MAKFKVKAYGIEYLEGEIEAKNEEEAQEKLLEKWEQGEVESNEVNFVFDGNEGFDLIKDIFSEECKEECDCDEDCGDDCQCK